jgi:hypothetical protein
LENQKSDAAIVKWVLGKQVSTDVRSQTKPEFGIGIFEINNSAVTILHATVMLPFKI